MRAALDFIAELDEETIRAVHTGRETRRSLKNIAEEQGFSRTAGERGHRLIRAHDNLEAFIAFYQDGVSHAMDAADAPEVDGNVADVTVRYPHGRPVRGLEQLMRNHELDPGDWEVESVTVNEWPTTIGATDSVIYVNNYQAKARLTKTQREPKFERVQPVSVEIGGSPSVEPVKNARPDGWETALILMDRQVGFRRPPQSDGLIPLHDRAAIDVAVQVAALLQPEVIVDVGDILDWSPLKDLNDKPQLKRLLQPALAETAYDNERFTQAAEPEEFHILEGNHDERLQEKILAELEEIYQLKDVGALANGGPPAASIPSLLRFEEAGITWHDGYPDNEILLNHGLAVEHGDTAKSDSGDTVRYLLKYQSGEYSRVLGHIHRFERADKTVWKGYERREISAASAGCLCRVDGGVPGVKDRQNWQQGILIAHFDPDGWKHVLKPLRIYDGTAWFRGTRIDAREPDLEVLSEKTGYDFT